MHCGVHGRLLLLLLLTCEQDWYGVVIECFEQRCSHRKAQGDVWTMLRHFPSSIVHSMPLVGCFALIHSTKSYTLFSSRRLRIPTTVCERSFKAQDGDAASAA
jgi:hypothetical protein